MGAFEAIVKTMMQVDVFQLFFPWLLVLAVTYGALDKYDWFEEDTINAAVAMSVAFIAIGGLYLFVPAGLFPHFAAAVAFGSFGIIGLMVLLAIAGVDLNELDKESPVARLALGGGVLAFTAILLIYIELPISFGSLADLLQGESFDEVVMPILTMVFLLAIVGVVTKSGEESDDG
ncbi:MAG: hypothetical protein BRC26_03735 [Nanohaloarchaea archaeon QH_8_44_6]|nr:MAG: hypothetical protein BRC26_03735 [Nanohaloarchaea archaeon QH_8_44_6]